MLRGWRRHCVSAFLATRDPAVYIPTQLNRFAARYEEFATGHEERESGVSRYSSWTLARLFARTAVAQLKPDLVAGPTPVIKEVHGPDGSAIALFGHGIVGATVLDALVAMDMAPVAVFTHRAGPADWQTDLTGPCNSYDIPCHIEPNLDSPEVVAKLRELSCDLILSAAYRTLIPDTVLAAARLGGFNLHGSLLPFYRGCAPVNWMVLNGETRGGVTLHVMEARPDRGPIVAQHEFPIGPENTGFDVLLQVAHGAGLLVDQHLPAILDGTATRTPQGRGTYFGRRGPEDGRINFASTAEEIVNLVRAVTRPYPGAFFETDGKRTMVWWARAAPKRNLPPGQVGTQDDRIYVGCADGAVELLDWAQPRPRAPHITGSA